MTLYSNISKHVVHTPSQLTLNMANEYVLMIILILFDHIAERMNALTCRTLATKMLL